MRSRVVDDIITMLHQVGMGRSHDDAVLVMARTYRRYVPPIIGILVFTRMLLGRDDPRYAATARGCSHTGDCGVVFLGALTVRKFSTQRLNSVQYCRDSCF